MNDYDYLKLFNVKLVGFAHLYLQRCHFESKSVEEMDIEIYSKLVGLDARLGIATFKQLYWCLLLAPRSDFVKVRIKFLNIATGIIFKIIDFARVEATMPNHEFSDVYLISCRKDFGSGVKIDVEVYKKLLELDTRLGRSVSDQLFTCLSLTTRPDIIKVCICNLNIQNF